MPTRMILLAAAAVGTLGFGLPGAAQTYPTRTVSLIVPYPPGGGVDAMARVVAEKLGAALGQQVMVDNRAGGSGLVGTRAAARSTPDGHTLFLGHTGSIAINPSLYANAGFDPRRDFAPIGLIATMPVALLANPAFPAKTIADVVAIAKQEGAKLNIGTSAVGTGGYLSAELFKSITNTDATIIPYKGTGQVMNDLVGGHVPIAFGVLPPALGNLQAGTLRAIAVFGDKRFSLLPDVPTANESGLPGFESVLHYGLLAPAGTPRPIVDKLHGELVKIIQSPESVARLAGVGAVPVANTPEQFAEANRKDVAKWGRIIRENGIRAD
jgi:tripartite-type tricarboxylate transporter receptor subunit TctC